MAHPHIRVVMKKEFISSLLLGMLIYGVILTKHELFDWLF